MNVLKNQIKPIQNNHQRKLVLFRKVTLVIKTTKIHPYYIIQRKKPTQVNKKTKQQQQQKNNTKNREASETCNPEKRHEYDRHECIFWKKYKNYHDALII